MGRAYSPLKVESMYDGEFAVTRVVDPDDEFAEKQYLSRDGLGNLCWGDVFQAVTWEDERSAKLFVEAYGFGRESRWLTEG